MLRHSINLNAETEQKTVITLFIADTLDYNTINIWRAVSMVPLQASNSDKIAENVTVAGLCCVPSPHTKVWETPKSKERNHSRNFLHFYFHKRHDMSFKKNTNSFK